MNRLKLRLILLLNKLDACRSILKADKFSMVALYGGMCHGAMYINPSFDSAGNLDEDAMQSKRKEVLKYSEELVGVITKEIKKYS